MHCVRGFANHAAIRIFDCTDSVRFALHLYHSISSFPTVTSILLSPTRTEAAASSGGLEDIEQALSDSQKTVDSKAHVGDDANSAAALAETARLAALTPAERQAAEQAKINAKLDELVIKPELDTLAKEKEKEEKEREEEEAKTKLKKASKVKRTRASASASSAAAASIEEAMKGDSGNGGNTKARVTPLTLADMQSVGTMCRVYWQQSVLTDAPIMLAMIGLHRVRAISAVPNSVPLMVKVEHFPEPALVKGDEHRAYAREITKLLTKMCVQRKIKQNVHVCF